GKHMLNVRIGEVDVLQDFFKLPKQHVPEFGELLPVLSVEFYAVQGLTDFINRSGGDRREVVDKIERILDLVRDARGELSERGKLFCLHQPILGGAKILKRFCQLACAGLDILEQAYILDCNDRLVSKCSHQ